MNSLIKRISTNTYDPPSSEQLDELEAQLYIQDPSTLDLSSVDLSPLAQTLTLHHAYVFYYAWLIHFYRTLRRHPPRHPQIQHLVTSAVHHLKDIEILGGDSIGCTLVWPPFIVACECIDEDMQRKILGWYVSKRTHGFMNLEISKDTAKEVWRRRRVCEEEVLDGDSSWQEVLRDLNMDIVLG